MSKYIKAKLVVTVLAVVLLGGVARVLAVSDPAPAAPGSTFAQRLAQRKAERAEVISTTDQTRLVSTCIGGQGNVRLVENGMVPILANRTTVYQRIDAKLWVTIGQLKLAGKDTFNLEQDRLALAGKTTNFQTISTNFSQTLDDIQVVNCQADVIGFKALVDTARIYYTQLQSQAADIRGYIVNTIQPELAKHDVFAAHIETELGIDPENLTNPVHAAVASALSFLAGAIIPLVVAVVLPASTRVPLTFFAVLIALIITGILSAKASGANVAKATTRVVIGGALAMIITYGIGLIFGIST